MLVDDNLQFGAFMLIFIQHYYFLNVDFDLVAQKK